MEYEIGRSCSTHRKLRNAYKILTGQAEGKIPLGIRSSDEKIILN
jgi:hypothetical protein